MMDTTTSDDNYCTSCEFARQAERCCLCGNTNQPHYPNKYVGPGAKACVLFKQVGSDRKYYPKFVIPFWFKVKMAIEYLILRFFPF